MKDQANFWMSKQEQRHYQIRKSYSYGMHTALVVATLLVLAPLCSILGYVIFKGAPGFNLDFFTQLPKPVGESGGGMANAILGSFTLIGLAALVGIPWGLGVGLYLSEYGKQRSLFTNIVRFSIDTLASLPSIIIGLFIYAAVVRSMGRFSAIAGGLALSLLMVPIIARTSEELLSMIPMHTREAGLALGLPRWKVILWIILKGSLAPLSTGVILALARIAGETAPLLFTAFNNQYWQSGLDQPIASIPAQIFNYATSPFDDWHNQAWTAAFLLVIIVMLLNLTTKFILRTRRA